LDSCRTPGAPWPKAPSTTAFKPLQGRYTQYLPPQGKDPPAYKQPDVRRKYLGLDGDGRVNTGTYDLLLPPPAQTSPSPPTTGRVPPHHRPTVPAPEPDTLRGSFSAARTERCACFMHPQPGLRAPGPA
jgi:hypothetical protein